MIENTNDIDTEGIEGEEKREKKKKMGYPPKLSTMGITLSTIGVKALIFFYSCVIIWIL